MSELYAGFGRVDVTPMMGINLAGYYQVRLADGVLDPLEINALALRVGEAAAILLSIDHCGIVRDIAWDYRRYVSEATGVPVEAVFLHTTHTHTAPVLRRGTGDPLEAEYDQFVRRRMADAARFALADLKPARMGFGTGTAPNIAFVRRFRMKDGSIQTNPGVDNPNILEPIGAVDERVHVLRFDREGADSLVLVNFGDHPDVVGGCKISADWPGFLRRTVEQALDGVRCIAFNGAQGDVNHVNVHPRGGDLNGMFLDFDDVARGYDHARYMGRVVAGAVLQTYDKVQYTPVERLQCLQKTIEIPSNMPAPGELPEACRINELHKAGRDSELPYAGMMLTTVVAEAERMVDLANGPASFPMELTGVAIGPVALLGIPGEPFTGIGRALKAAPGWAAVLPSCNTNGKEGYFPMQEAYDEGGYESRSSYFRAGVAERIIEEGLALLADLRK
ncbi:MAG: hypothetical protein HFF17_08480 [Oscillospiraceae bacterium]|nr:hypothetical protein [Oscillospiraceae bacterium]